MSSLMAVCVAKPVAWCTRAVLLSSLPSDATAGVVTLSGGVCFCLSLVFYRKAFLEKWTVFLALLEAAATLCFYLSLSSLPLLNAVVLYTLHLVFDQLSETLEAGGGGTSVTFLGWTLCLAGYFLNLTEISTTPGLSLRFRAEDNGALAASLCAVLLTSARRGLGRCFGSDAVSPVAMTIFTFLAEFYVGTAYASSRYVLCRLIQSRCNSGSSFLGSVWREGVFWLYITASAVSPPVSYWTERISMPRSDRHVLDAYSILWSALWMFLSPREIFDGWAGVGGCLVILGLSAMTVERQTSSSPEHGELEDDASEVASLLVSNIDFLQSGFTA